MIRNLVLSPAGRDPAFIKLWANSKLGSTNKSPECRDTRNQSKKQVNLKQSSVNLKKASSPKSQSVLKKQYLFKFNSGNAEINNSNFRFEDKSDLNLENSLKSKLELSQKIMKLGKKLGYANGMIRKSAKDKKSKPKPQASKFNLEKKEISSKASGKFSKKTSPEPQRKQKTPKLNKTSKHLLKSPKPRFPKEKAKLRICRSISAELSYQHDYENTSNPDIKLNSTNPLHQIPTLKSLKSLKSPKSSKSSKHTKSFKPTNPSNPPRVRRQISFIDTSDLDSLIPQYPEVSSPAVSSPAVRTTQAALEGFKLFMQNNRKDENSSILEEIKRNIAARKIQRAFWRYLKKSDKNSSFKVNKLQTAVKDQICWAKAQLTSIEYLRDKEFEDLESLVSLIPASDAIRETLFGRINSRFEHFVKVFRGQLDQAEQVVVEEMDVGEVVEFSNKVNDTRDVVNKIIQMNNLENSLLREDFEGMVNQEKDGSGLVSESCQTVEEIKKLVKSQKRSNLETISVIMGTTDDNSSIKQNCSELTPEGINFFNELKKLENLEQSYKNEEDENFESKDAQSKSKLIQIFTDYSEIINQDPSLTSSEDSDRESNKSSQENNQEFFTLKPDTCTNKPSFIYNGPESQSKDFSYQNKKTLHKLPLLNFNNLT